MIKEKRLKKYMNIIDTNDLIMSLFEKDFKDNKEIIKKYHQYTDKKLYEEILAEYKVRYIYNESKVEGNITPEEQLGIAAVYDYINDFDFNKDYFNIFTTSLVIHQKLYSKCVGKEFGGKLRDSQAILQDSLIEVMDPIVAQKKFNEYIAVSDKIFEPLNEGDVLGYIELCIKTITELIKIQPFADGNKRTFRSLLNLLLKKATLPPVYIDIPHRLEYKELLLKAMRNNDYNGLYEFYYDRIEESIRELALDNATYFDDEAKTKKLFLDIKRI